MTSNNDSVFFLRSAIAYRSHILTLENASNKKYFDIRNYVNLENAIREFEVEPNLKIEEKEIYKFIAHLAPPSALKPLLLFDIQLSQELSSTIEIELSNELCDKKVCNSEGWFIREGLNCPEDMLIPTISDNYVNEAR